MHFFINNTKSFFSSHNLKNGKDDIQTFYFSCGNLVLKPLVWGIGPQSVTYKSHYAS